MLASKLASKREQGLTRNWLGPQRSSTSCAEEEEEDEYRSDSQPVVIESFVRTRLGIYIYIYIYKRKKEEKGERLDDVANETNVETTEGRGREEMQRVRNERGGKRKKRREKERKKNEGVRSSRVGNETEPCINAKEIKGEERERERERKSRWPMHVAL